MAGERYERVNCPKREQCLARRKIEGRRFNCFECRKRNGRLTAAPAWKGRREKTGG
jgi:hypothetical protein